MTSFTIYPYHLFFVISYLFLIMTFRLTLSTLLTLPPVEMCIRMIPPEDVSLGTTSATLSTTQASLMITTQCTAPSCQTSTTTPGKSDSCNGFLCDVYSCTCCNCNHSYCNCCTCHDGSRLVNPEGWCREGG